MIDDLWYKNAVIYCLSVATYMDANGDDKRVTVPCKLTTKPIAPL